MNKKMTGTTYILISAFFFGSYGIWSRLMATDFGIFSQAWTRGLFLFILVFLLNLKLKFLKKVKLRDWPWLLTIALAGGLNQAPYFFGFKYLDIGTATMLFYAALVIGGYLLGGVIFREKITFIKYLSLIVAILGIYTIYKLSLASQQILPAIMTILAGLMGSISAILPKKLSQDYSELQIMSGYFLVMFVANGLIAIIINDPLPSLSINTSWLSQLGYAFAMLIANFTVIEGFKTIDASIGSLIGLAEIIFGILFGFIIFYEPIGLGTIIGSTLIILSTVLPNIKKLTC